ncbi:unnamed protein product [Chironomus riparius]|uniref:Uncharacterized protein n=1 Tax=Chironomus riparius TaxID=315576 RepID=A0A9N9RRT9_9DIPT|nr:unnamed protein product [Chironomus riparius]
MKLLMVFVTIACFSTGSCEFNADDLSDNLINLKDDCGYICGKINVNINRENCGDPDKRKYPFLLVHDPHDHNEEAIEYFEPKHFECDNKCPENLHFIKADNNSYCVKDISHFIQDLESAKTRQDNKDAQKNNKEQKDNFEYTWWIVGGVGILLVAIIALVIGLFIKKRSGNVDFELPSSRPIIKI